MLINTATFSLNQARQRLSYGWGDHPFATQRRAWVGFETGDNDTSPLHDVFDGESLVVRCADWDVDGRHSPAQVGSAQCIAAPTIEHARSIVHFVRKQHARAEKIVLCVHCQAGLFRSGAVVEWVREDLGIPEWEHSNRNVDVIGETPDQRIFNLGLLRLIRTADAEYRR